MSDELDSVEWLRKASSEEWCGSALNKCDNEIERLREENARLRKALRPFAAPVKDFRHSVPDRLVVEEEFTLGQLRAAAAALREGGKDE